MSNIKHVTWWMETAINELAQEPESILHNLTGTGWTSEVEQVYFHPTTQEEWLASREIHNILLQAFERSLASVRGQHKTQVYTFDRIDIAEVYCLTNLLNELEPLKSVQGKIMFDGWCKKYLNKSFEKVALLGFGGVLIPVEVLQI